MNYSSEFYLNHSSGHFAIVVCMGCGAVIASECKEEHDRTIHHYAA